VRLVRIGGTAIAYLAGDVDCAYADELAIGLAEAMSGDHVIVDLTQATFIDSTVINALVIAHRAAELAKATLTVVPGPASVMHTLSVSGVDEFLTFDPRNNAESPGNSAHARPGDARS
jgi:anti-anti-sigma factor